MRLAAVGNFWYPERGGGLERYFHGLMLHLAAMGDCIDYFVTSDTPPTSERLRGHAIGRLEAGLPKRMMGAFNAYRKQRTAQFEVVNVHFALNVAPMLHLIPKETPIVFHFHGPWASESKAEGASPAAVFAKFHLERYILRHGARFITASESFASLLATEYGIAPRSITSIPLAIDTDFFTPVDRTAARRDLGWDESAFIVFTARRLVNRVGVRELITAAGLLSSEDHLQIKISGRGPLESEYRAKAKAETGNRVELVGFLSESDLRSAYAAANVVVLPTQELEGFGLTVAEALACGTPVIATPVGGIPENLLPLSPDLVAGGSTPADIASALCTAISRFDRLPDRHACREYAVARFSWAKNVESVRNVFAAAAAAANNGNNRRPCRPDGKL